MNRKFTGIACITAAFCVIACHKDHHDDNDNNLSKMDRTFVTQAGYANSDEIAAGGVAAAKGSDSAVKMFGAFMVTEHSTAQGELKTIANNLSDVTVPDTPDSVHIAMMQKMALLSGHAFDTAYIKSQINDHNTAMALFQQEATYGENTRLRNYAAKYLPHIIMHKEMADSIWAGLH
jgi:putative membrane protein